MGGIFVRYAAGALQSFLSGWVMMVFILGMGVYLSIRFRFFQLRGIRFILKHTAGSLLRREKKSRGGAISPFQAVSTALSGTMGVGNIAGVATALAAGGAGAVFWMWVSAFFGMMTKYAEIYLAVRFREKNGDGSYRGGPMYYMEKGLGSRRMGCIFALLCALCSFGIGNMTQINAVSGAVRAAFGVPARVSGVLGAVLVALVIFGGLRRIASVNEMIIPFVSVAYIVCSVSALARDPAAVGGAFSLILREAFRPRSAAGGALGYTMAAAMRYGLSRGVFTNEAGLGSAPIAHAAADCKSPEHQSVWGIFEVFLDTIVVCTLTALVLLCAQQGRLWRSGLDGVEMTGAAFTDAFGPAGGCFIAVSVVLFAVSGMLGWCFYGESALGYLTGQHRPAILLYRLLFVGCIVLGAVSDLQLVWNVADVLNALMAVPNILALFLLRRHIRTP